MEGEMNVKFWIEYDRGWVPLIEPFDALCLQYNKEVLNSSVSCTYIRGVLRRDFRCYCNLVLVWWYVRKPTSYSQQFFFTPRCNFITTTHIILMYDIKPHSFFPFGDPTNKNNCSPKEMILMRYNVCLQVRMCVDVKRRPGRRESVSVQSLRLIPNYSITSIIITRSNSIVF